jgi:hypothetical protein
MPSGLSFQKRGAPSSTPSPSIPIVFTALALGGGEALGDSGVLQTPRLLHKTVRIVKVCHQAVLAPLSDRSETTATYGLL